MCDKNYYQLSYSSGPFTDKEVVSTRAMEMIDQGHDHVHVEFWKDNSNQYRVFWANYRDTVEL